MSTESVTNPSPDASPTEGTASPDTVTRDLIAGELKMSAADIGPADVLKDLPGADSMKLLRVVSKLERHYDVEFEDEEIFAATTVAELTALVARQVGEAP